MDSFDKGWFVLQTYSGYENKVKENLLQRAQTYNMLDNILRVEIPTQTVQVEKNGKKKEVEENRFPGYVLVEMVMTDEAWYVVRNTSGVTGFIGSSGGGAKPFPLQRSELDPILKKMGLSSTTVEVDFQEGDEVDVIDGPFVGKRGKVESIDTEKEIAKVLVDFLGNLTQVDIELTQLQKVDI